MAKNAEAEAASVQIRIPIPTASRSTSHGYLLDFKWRDGWLDDDDEGDDLLSEAL